MVFNTNPLFVANAPALQRRRTTSVGKAEAAPSSSSASPSWRIASHPASVARIGIPKHVYNVHLLKQWTYMYGRIWLHGGVVWPVAFVLWQLLFQRVVDVSCRWIYPQLAATNDNVASCTNVRSGEYWNAPQAPGNRLLAAWNMLFDGVLISAVAPIQLITMYGTRVHRLFILAVCAGAVVYGTLHAAAWSMWGWTLSDTRLGLITAVSWLYSVVVSGWQFGTILHDRAAGLRWIGMHVVAYVPARLYLQLLPTLVTRSTTAGELLVLRFIIHPSFWWLIEACLKRICLDAGVLHGGRQTVLIFWPIASSTLFARFLTLQLGATGNVLVIQLVLTFGEIMAGLTCRLKWALLHRWWYGFGAAAVIAGDKGYILLQLLTSCIRTYLDIGFTIWFAVLTSVWRLTGTPGVPPSHRLVWYEAAVQITTTLLGELLGRFLQAKFFDTDVPWCWAQIRHGWWSFAVHSLWMAAALYTNSRYVWALFCPRDYGAPRGVLWEYCERPPYKSVTLDWALLAPRNAEFS